MIEKECVVKTRKLSNLEKVLDTDVGQNTILSFLDTKDYHQLMLVNRRHQFFNKLSPSVLLPRLIYHFAQVPDEAKANFMFRRNPKLNLLNVEITKVEFPSYIVTNVTLLQLVHGAGDIEMRDRVLKPLFEEQYGKEKGIEEMKRQIGEMKNVHKPFDFWPIIQAISNESFNNGKDEQGRWILSVNTLAAIEKFRKDFDDNQPKVIDKAMQFRWQTLQDFNDAYDSAAAYWHYNYYKCALIEDAVQAWVLRYATQNDKQRFNQGVYYLQRKDPEPFYRSQTNRSGYSFDDSLLRPSVDFVLNGSCVDIVLGETRVASGGRRRGGHACKIFVENKLQGCGMSQPGKKKISTCVIS